MKRTPLSLFTAALLVSSSYAADTLQEAFTNGTFKGHIRAFYIDRNWQGDLASAKTDNHAFSTSLWLGYKTASYEGVSVGVTLASVNDFGLNPSDPAKLNTSILGDNGDSFSFVPEAYIKYKRGKTCFKAGRQKLATPMLGPDDARAMPTYFTAYTLTNQELPSTTIIASHVTQIAPGTFFNQYRNPHKHGLVLTAGYGATYEASIGQFHDIGWYTAGKSTSGITFIGVENSSITGVKLKLYDYYAYDLFNTLYLEGSYSFKVQNAKPFVALQYINQKDVGDGYLKYVEDIPTGNVDSNYYGLKIGASFGNAIAYAAYSKTDKSTDAALNGSIISPWGGMPAFTQGMVTRHQFLADTSAWKVAGAYKWSDFGLNLKTALYYASFDVGSANPYSPGHSWTATEYGFDFIYQATKDLQLRFRGNFPRSFYEDAQGQDLGWNELRFIANYYF